MTRLFYEEATSKRVTIVTKGGEAALLAVILFLFVSLALMFGFSALALDETKTERTQFNAKRSYFAAESGMEDAVYRLMRGMDISAEETLDVDGNVVTTDIAHIGSTREILSEGIVTSNIRRLRAVLLEGSGISFFYGAHIGEGGLVMSSNATVNGNVFSNGNIVGLGNSIINGDAAAVGTISSPQPVITGTRSSGASPIPLPPIDLDFWRRQANINNNPIVGDYILNDGSDSFGPKKVSGNFTLKGNSQFTVTGPLHITGNFKMHSNTVLWLNESFGSTGTVIVVDGTLEFESNSVIHGTSASPKGYILFVTPSSSGKAIELDSNTSLEAALYATTGTVDVSSKANVTAITAYKLSLSSNAKINYDIGLANAVFSSGPSGGFEISTWREVE